ncbi:MAG: L,D-transpeptidase [Eubacterium sp.]|nr:L,D-transpeptidase [Eubacterium sp.]
MGTNNKSKNIILKIIPGLLLILFSILLFIYYPKTTSQSQVKETTHKYVSAINVDLKKNKHDSLFKKVKSRPKDNRVSLEKKAKKKINYKSSVPYKVKINRAENFVMIYGIDIHGKYKIPYKCFICSSAKNIKNTLLGDYRLNDRYRWHQMVDGSFAQYAIRFYDKLMLHSVPYYRQAPNSLEVDEYNKLGHFASLGCIRMRVSDIKWIYKHCNYGTEIKIYDKKGEKPPIPYEKPQRLDKKDTKSSWDPTDPDKKNPWKE